MALHLKSYSIEAQREYDSGFYVDMLLEEACNLSFLLRCLAVPHVIFRGLEPIATYELNT